MNSNKKGDLNVTIGNKFDGDKFMVVSIKGSVWSFEDEDELQNFLTGRRIDHYQVYQKDNEVRDTIEQKVYGPEGQFS